MFDLLLLSGVVGSFLVNLPGRMDGDELFVRYFLALVLILSFFLSPKREVKSKTLGVFLLVALTSVAFSFRTPIIGVFKELLLGLLAVKFIAGRESLTPSKVGIALVCFWTVVNVLLVCQKMGLIYQNEQLAGPFLMPWIMGSMAALSVPFVKSFNVRWLVVLLPAVLLSHSTACAATAVALLVYPKISFKVVSASVIALLAYILFFDNSLDSARFEVWTRSFAHIHNFWIGNGIGAWAHEGFAKANGADMYHWTTAHNLYYQTFFEMGFLGLGALGAVLWSLWVKSYGPCRSALLGLLMLSLVHPIVHFPRFSVFLVILAAMILRNDGLKTQKGA